MSEARRRRGAQRTGVRVRARRELVQAVPDALAEGGRVGGQPVQPQYVLAQPAPELFNRVQPGRIGRQPDYFQPVSAN